MITAHPLIQVHLIAPQLFLWIALPHHGDIMLATNYLFCRCYSVPCEQHADETEKTVRLAHSKDHSTKRKRSRTRLQLVSRQNGYWKTNCFVMEVERSYSVDSHVSL